LAVLLFLPAPDARAQNNSLNPYGLSDVFSNPLRQLQQRLASTAYANAMLPMEGAVDPDEYVVGPGDVFTVTDPLVQGTNQETVVGADGRVLLPDVEPVMVAGLTLGEARSRMLSVLKEGFKNTRVEIVLVQSRQFYVHVAGAVPKPGRALALPVARVSTILEAAYADTTWAPVTNADLRPSLRNIRVEHTDGTMAGVDLLQYFASGDTDSNPYVRDGDVIYVAAFDPAFESIYVDGAVLFPGPYDYRPGDTIKNLISVAGGISGPASVEDVRLRREMPDGTIQTSRYSLQDVLEGPAGSIDLQRRDHVSVSRVKDLLGSASAEGLGVSDPGTYPINDGRTTVAELIEMAGGTREDALLRGAYLERRALPEFVQKPRRSVFEKPLSDIENILVADSTEIMQRLRLTELDFLSRAYFAQEIRMQNRVSLDLEGILAGTAEPVVLRDGDRLHIPRDERTVFVLGQVRRPGFVTYREGETGEYYINLAGGRGDFAAEAVVINPGTSYVQPLGSQVIRSGDTIFVDRREDIAENPELQRLVSEQERSRADAKIRITQTILQSVTTIASVVAIIVSISRN
jgi:protein involved in polysaccharide export with SLBB domain